jgi:hypothetical protein
MESHFICQKSDIFILQYWTKKKLPIKCGSLKQKRKRPFSARQDWSTSTEIKETRSSSRFDVDLS